MANMQYGFDLAAVGSLQAMPGFLKVFGYRDPSSDTGYAIDVSVIFLRHDFMDLANVLLCSRAPFNNSLHRF